VGGGVASGTLALTGIGTLDASVLTVSNCSIASNSAQGGVGGAGANGGDGLGGGIFVGAGTATIDPTQIRFNDAQGGAAGSGGAAGNGIGSGLYISAGATVFLSKETVVDDNTASTSNDNIFGSYTLM